MTTNNVARTLDRSNPAAARAKLGSTLNDLIAAHNDLATKYNALLAKLDGDTGVASTDYVATVGPAESVEVLGSR
jgi:hypothetical protein